ncbi:pleiotropic drug resistance ABC transporter [Infundibulicybe gibba]|nr:pleiotropic drug resistance ABC transporter [Infundibulicybe gibba]
MTIGPDNDAVPPPQADTDLFDAPGVSYLRRTMANDLAGGGDPAKHVSETGSEITLPIEEHFDFEKTLRHVIKSRDEAGVKARDLGVMFDNLRVIGLSAAATRQPTLGSVLNPLSALEAIQSARYPPTHDILHGFEGVVRPGEMILVLGRPGSGCSTLLKTLANQRAEYHAVEGHVHYDSLTSEQIEKHYRGDIIYSPEDDVHFPSLTVEQTIKFAATVRAPHQRLGYSRKDYSQLATDALLAAFGLTHARNTPVGDAAIRGISGGEKKRVSICEVLASRACIGVWDNSTRGLDSSTALEFIQALRIATDIARLSTIVSLYQAGESLYDHFDKVCVIYEGRMAYFGPAKEAKDYFINMGNGPQQPHSSRGVSVMPRDASEFAAHFKNSKIGAANRAAIAAYREQYVGRPEKSEHYRQSAMEEHATTARARAVMTRRIQILRGDLFVTGLNLFSWVFQAIIYGTIFLKEAENTASYFSRGGVLFSALLFAALVTMAEIPACFPSAYYTPTSALGVVPSVHGSRSNDGGGYPCFTDYRFSIFHDFVSAGRSTANSRPVLRLSTFYLFLTMVFIVMKAYFRALAAACKSEATAQTFAGISILASAIYTGYTIPEPSMIGALKWIRYLNPLRFGFESVMANEFKSLNGTCSGLIPQGPGYENITLANQVCATVGSLPGQLTVDGVRFIGLSYGYSPDHIWRNLGICIAFGIGFIAALFIFTEINTTTLTQNEVVLYKRGRKEPRSGPVDVEKVVGGASLVIGEKHRNTTDELTVRPKNTDIFSFTHLNYTVPLSGEETKRLLEDVSGYVVPGKLTALMGESGAGKTTLLNVLAQRVTTGVITGDRFVNGLGLPADFQSKTGYCQQLYTHLPTATVQEALLFSAKVRQPTSVPLAEKEAYVDKCLRLCGLEAYRDAAVGSLGVECRKRTTIGVELAAKPQLLLFLDEPTSGLDSQSAWSVVSFLRDLANNGQAILCTIHQPSAELFQVFDRLLLLRKGGQTVYFGDLGHNASTLIDYFERNGSRPCGPRENPAEFMLDVIGAGATAHSGTENWHDIWRKSAQSKQLDDELVEIHNNGRNHAQSDPDSTLHTEFATPWLYQAVELTKREATNSYRNPDYLMAKLMLNITSGLFIGFSFYKAKDTQQGTQNKLFSMYMATILIFPLANQIMVPYIATRNVYETRERPSRMYSWTALVTSQILIEIPWNILGSSIFFVTWYWTSGFDTSRAGYTYLIIGVLFPMYYATIGQGVASMASSAEIGGILFSLIFSFAVNLSGVLQPFSQLNWWKWLYRISPMTYMIEGLLGQAIGRQQITCAPMELLPLEPPTGQTCGQYMEVFISSAGGYLQNPAATSDCQFCTVRSSDHLLQQNFNIFYDNRWRDVGIVAGFIVFNIAATYLLTYWFRIRTTSMFDYLPKRRQTKKT